jgi:hypothetical protein
VTSAHSRSTIAAEDAPPERDAVVSGAPPLAPPVQARVRNAAAHAAIFT